MENEKSSWTICLECQGIGKKSRRFKKNGRVNIQLELDQFEKKKLENIASIAPNQHLLTCPNCSGSGLIPSTSHPKADNDNFPHVGIIGGGIGGVALAVACLHRGIPFTLFERDQCFDARSQGYGLTLQQASKAIKGLGIFTLKEGVNSTRHVVHTAEGKMIGEWGMRKRKDIDSKSPPKRTNIHIARQSLRLAQLDQLNGLDALKWNHQLIDFKEDENKKIELTFQVEGKTITSKVDLLVGADGIRSSVRNILIGEDINPLRYLGCIVILGISSLKELEALECPLLDSATVFQTANGNERIYVMPFTKDAVMWQLSFPLSEMEAQALSAQGAQALKDEAIRRTPWHTPIPQILEATSLTHISGYPVYDRELLKTDIMENWENVTLIGDAAHPMSPFKGQGANQAILDALSLAREIAKSCYPGSQWKDKGLRKSVLTNFEIEMLERSASKVKSSAEAVHFLHSEVVLLEGDRPRGRLPK